ncbi:hypothetical protein DM02DRAFT_718321 [Periconia macrospinosa]|uniref:Rad21/Rec8-like protein N-terminal domain-containing protein n=1 Tax=Periconia macrospinosa TaxID=97972 RepID=A0A2V1DQQ4_9PLEO|nr:hypothetical protein DM02DRAFT_718321 [Periconia macrospinosa]
MFYPAELLRREGALARVWMAANVEKKLTKAQVLQDKIDEDISEIMRPRVPLSLRLSGSLLLGVVRIYSRKARYLLDDCSDALWKIKMAFKPGNIDLPAHSHVANPAALTLPDTITDIDLLAPMPDPSLLLSQSLDLGDIPLPDLGGTDWDSSQFLSTSVEQPRAGDDTMIEFEDLGIDFSGNDVEEDVSIEIGRDAGPAQRLSEEFSMGGKELEGEDDLNLDLGADLSDDEGTVVPDIGGDTDIPMGGTELELEPAEDVTATEALAPEARERSLSPLSELGENEARALEEEIQNTSIFQLAPGEQQEEDEEEAHQARAKRRRVIQQDTQTQMSTSQIREHQINHEDILKPVSFLPRDPMLMALMNMQKSGGFVSSILGDGRSQGWAPELRGILSMEIVSRPSQKRKRDSGIADVGAAGEQAAAGAEKTPHPESDDEISPEDQEEVVIGDDTIIEGEDGEHIQLPEDDIPIPQDDIEEVFSPLPENFDETTLPLLHPAESGVVSLETKHAVHLLRTVFGDAGETDEEERLKNVVPFQSMFPEDRTSKADAARMFNEILVLATKDAIKVEQVNEDNKIGGQIRIRAKRGLWGSWAETDVSGAEAIKAAEAAEAAQASAASAVAADPIPSADVATEE